VVFGFSACVPKLIDTIHKQANPAAARPTLDIALFIKFSLQKLRLLFVISHIYPPEFTLAQARGELKLGCATKPFDFTIIPKSPSNYNH
jgi:hypothetical protein